MNRYISGRYIPENSTAHEIGDAVVYTYEGVRHNGSKYFGAIAYHGKANKPDFHYTFGNLESRVKHVQAYFAGRAEFAEYKAKIKAERSKPHTLKVGDILDCSWGYDQTQADFYQVTRVIGPHTVEIRQIAAKTVKDSEYKHGMADMRVPEPNAFIGEPLVRRANSTNSVMAHASYAHASLWNGKPNYCSWYA